MPSRPRLGSVLCAVLFLTAGCVSSGPPTGDSSPTPAATTAPADSSERRPAITTECPWHCLDDRPSPHHSVRLENDWNRSVEFRVRVVRDATNETVHDETHTLVPGTRETAYDVAAASPNGIETFGVSVAVLNTTLNTSIRTSECYGSAAARVQRNGEPFVSYSIC